MKNAEATQLWRQLFCITDRMREAGTGHIGEEVASLTFNQLRMIKHVYLLTRDCPDGVTLKVLAEALEITPAAASEMVDSLVRKNVLCREHNPNDRRAVAITLAEGCRKRFRESEKKFDEMTMDFLNTLSAESREEFTSVVHRFFEQMNRLEV